MRLLCDDSGSKLNRLKSKRLYDQSRARSRPDGNKVTQISNPGSNGRQRMPAPNNLLASRESYRYLSLNLDSARHAGLLHGFSKPEG